MQLQQDLEAIQAAGIQVVGISYDSPDVLSEFAKEKKIGFPLLSDEESKVIEAYHVLNDKVRFERAKGVPHPGTFVIGPDGKVKAKLFYDVRNRHSTKELIDTNKPQS